MEIVPQDRVLVVKAKASPTDADDLVIGMETQIRFPALQEKNIPIVTGKISKVSADSFEDERTGMHYFEIEVMVPPEELARLREIRADGGLRAGLPAEVIVPLRKRTALAYLLSLCRERSGRRAARTEGHNDCDSWSGLQHAPNRCARSPDVESCLSTAPSARRSQADELCPSAPAIPTSLYMNTPRPVLFCGVFGASSAKATSSAAS